MQATISHAQLKKWVEHRDTWFAKNEGVRGHRAQAKGAELELSMLDVIGYDWWTGEGITSKWLKRQLDANKDVKFIRVLLNSPGGDYFEGVAIHNLLKRHGAKVIVEIIGEAASAASVIALAGDEIQIHHGCLIMVHQAWSMAQGNASDFEATAVMLRQVNESAIDIYVDRTGLPREQVTALVDKTTWIGADEAVANGWADKVIPTGAAPERAPNTITANPDEDKHDPSHAQQSSSLSQPKSEESKRSQFGAFEAALAAAEFRKL